MPLPIPWANCDPGTPPSQQKALKKEEGYLDRRKKDLSQKLQDEAKRGGE